MECLTAAACPSCPTMTRRRRARTTDHRSYQNCPQKVKKRRDCSQFFEKECLPGIGPTPIRIDNWSSHSTTRPDAETVEPGEPSYHIAPKDKIPRDARPNTSMSQEPKLLIRLMIKYVQDLPKAKSKVSRILMRLLQRHKQTMKFDAAPLTFTRRGFEKRVFSKARDRML